MKKWKKLRRSVDTIGWRSSDYDPERLRGVWFCRSELEEYFQLPVIRPIYLVASTREMPHSYRVRRCGVCRNRLWVYLSDGSRELVHVVRSTYEWLPADECWVRVEVEE